jgi:hypothetical protein
MALNFPSNPTVGDIYTINGESWQWNGNGWIGVADETTYSPVTISTFAPASPVAGDLWWNSNTGNMFVYYVDPDSAQWVSISTPAGQIVTVDADQVVSAFLTTLPEYANIASAVAAGVPTGGMFKVTGATDVTGIRTVATYLP